MRQNWNRILSDEYVVDNFNTHSMRGIHQRGPWTLKMITRPMLTLIKDLKMKFPHGASSATGLDCRRLQLGPELLHDLHAHPSAIERAGLSPQMQTVLRALYADTHFLLVPSMTAVELLWARGRAIVCRHRLLLPLGEIAKYFAAR